MHISQTQIKLCCLYIGQRARAYSKDVQWNQHQRGLFYYETGKTIYGELMKQTLEHVNLLSCRTESEVPLNEGCPEIMLFYSQSICTHFVNHKVQ
jgi:hypothetical protein